MVLSIIDFSLQKLSFEKQKKLKAESQYFFSIHGASSNTIQQI